MSTSRKIIDTSHIQLCTEAGDPLPDRKTISEANQEGLWHKAIHVLVVDISTATILAQKRSPFVKVHPSRIELSVGGAVSYGESLRAACARELFEEVGIRAAPQDFQFLFQSKYNHYLSRLGLHTKIILTSYILLLHDSPKLQFHDHEATEATFITYDMAHRLANKETLPDIGELSPQYDYYQKLLRSIEPYI